MIIGIDASRANKDKKTGVEWYSYHLIEEFKKLDKENRYFLYTNKPLKGDLAKCPENFEEKQLKWWLPRFWTLGRLSWEMKFGKQKPDVLFVPAHTLPFVVPKKAVVTVHDIGFEHFPKLYKWPDKLYHKFTIKVIKRLATKILTVSNFSKKDIAKTYSISEEKIDVVYNGYDSENYKPSRLSFRPERSGVEKSRSLDSARDDSGGGARDDKKQTRDLSTTVEVTKEKSDKTVDYKYLLFIGRLEEKKNIPRLVEAFAEFKQKYPQDKHKLVLIGSKGFGFDRVEELIEKFKLKDDVILPGWVEDKMLPVWLSNATAFVFPSLFEGFGIPAIEAMACDCPVICSNTTSLPEVVGEAALMFDPENKQEIVSRIEQVLLNESVRDTLRTKGGRRARQFSWRKCAEETLKVLGNCETKN